MFGENTTLRTLHIHLSSTTYFSRFCPPSCRFHNIHEKVAQGRGLHSVLRVVFVLKIITDIN